MEYPTFNAGDILKMGVGSRSHMKQPYYVLVVSYNKDAKENGEILMTTKIPNAGTMSVILGNNEQYQLPRMTKVGTYNTHKHLLENQPLILNGKPFHENPTHLKY